MGHREQPDRPEDGEQAFEQGEEQGLPLPSAEQVHELDAQRLGRRRVCRGGQGRAHRHLPSASGEWTRYLVEPAATGRSDAEAEQGGALGPLPLVQVEGGLRHIGNAQPDGERAKGHREREQAQPPRSDRELLARPQPGGRAADHPAYRSEKRSSTPTNHSGPLSGVLLSCSRQ